MLAEKSEYLQEAAQSVYVANADDIVRQKCLAREEAERHERTVKRNMDLLKKENETLTQKNEELAQQLDVLVQEKDALIRQIEELKAQHGQK